MLSRKFSFRLVATIFALALLLAGTCAVAQEKVLHGFGNKSLGGLNPYSNLIFDASGDLYGTTLAGGHHNLCTVLELTPNADGGWTGNVLYSFGENATDASVPYAGLVFDGAGNLYGTTMGGGAYSFGAVFELTPASGGGWTEQVLHSFNRYGDGAYPVVGLAIDAAGNLFGATSTGGYYDYGTAFELSPAAGGGWTETMVHAFNDGNGGYAVSALIFDGAGNLYGSARSGGLYGRGTVFELSSAAGGKWTEQVLHAFSDDATEGSTPYSSLIVDSAGNLYGTTFNGGSGVCAYGIAGYCGTVFELTPLAHGAWAEKLLHAFVNAEDGWEPYAGLIFDGVGSLYGTTVNGGAYGYGTVFEIKP